MYEYAFVECSLGGLFSQSNYKEIISEYGRRGYRLAHILQSAHNLEGRPIKHELIFEKKVSEEK